MSSVKSEKTTLEQKVSKALWHRGIRFRKNVVNLFGKPDIAIKKKRLSFSLTCFWHGCIEHCRFPVSNTEYWEEKINKNRSRDELVSMHYKSLGWNVLRIWEHELKRNFDLCIEQLEREIK